MIPSNSDRFVFEHFEGSLEFLVYLIQKEELDLDALSLKELFSQFRDQNSGQHSFNYSGEFLQAASYLIWLKGKRLLPTEVLIEEEQIVEAPLEAAVKHLIDYCKFKQASKELFRLEEEQRGCYFRGKQTLSFQLPLGIEHVSLEDLSLLFKGMLAKAKIDPPQMVKEEEWQIGDKMSWILNLLSHEGKETFLSLFQQEQTRLEKITIFLALLELIKNGKIGIGKDKQTQDIYCYIVG